MLPPKARGSLPVLTEREGDGGEGVAGCLDGMPHRGTPLWHRLDRFTAAMERSLVGGAAGNPLLESGAAANFCLALATVTGVLLLLWYVPSQQQAHASTVGMGGRTLAGFVRSLHRYASDAAMGFVLWHALRMLAQRRVSGPRWLAWVSGVAMAGILWSLGWTGYWLLWDRRGQRVAEASARLVDALHLVPEPLQRSFLVQGELRGLLFFLVFFFHMIVPLAIGLGLWFHLARLRRTRFWPSRRTRWWLLAVLGAVSLAVPADVGAAARLDRVAVEVPLDLWFLVPLPLIEAASMGWVLAGGVGLGVLLFGAPRWLRRRSLEAPAARVDPARCFACEQCIEDCPYGAISAVARSDGRPFPWTAEVDPVRCVRCGICVGSCSSGGVELPVAAQRLQSGRGPGQDGDVPRPGDARPGDGRDGFPGSEHDRLARIAAWGAETPGGVPVAFVCEEVLAGSIQVDAATGRVRGAALPGDWRLLCVPCAGWLRAGFLSRAFSSGMREARLIGCPRGQCRFREGNRWAADRLDGRRRPWLKRSQRMRVRWAEVAAGDREGLRAALEEGVEERRRGGGPVRRAAAGVGAVAALAWSGAAPVDPLPDSRPELVVTARLVGRLVERCRELSPRERAELPPHMRRTRRCERRRAAVRLRVTLDGRTLVRRRLEPSGLWRDGPSVALLRFRLAPGTHRIQVELDPSDEEPPGWPLRFERSERLRRGERLVVSYDGEHGFSVAGGGEDGKR